VSHPKTADLEALLEVLHRGGVAFIVVGGTAAVLHGAPITTQDLDIVHSRDPDNIERLVAVLESIDAIFRPAFSGRRLRPTAQHLAGTGQINLSTTLGPLDPLCVMDGRDYDELLEHTIEVTDGDVTLRVIDLPTLIEAKTRAGRPKDRLALPILLRLAQESDGTDI
jgi:hypothetical protein